MTRRRKGESLGWPIYVGCLALWAFLIWQAFKDVIRETGHAIGR